MGRKHPRFLYCEAIDTKSEGPFVIHALQPKFICRLSFDEKRNITGVHYLDYWDETDMQTRFDTENDLIKWYNFSGRKNSSHPKDILLAQLSELSFLKEYQNEYTIDEAVQIINICFPTKVKAINQSHSSYGLKHLLERISEKYTPGYNRKYCSNDTMKSAFEIAGFKFTVDGPNCSYNISEKEYKDISILTR